MVVRPSCSKVLAIKKKGPSWSPCRSAAEWRHLIVLVAFRSDFDSVLGLPAEE